jgi:hypothetical protein
MSFFRLMLVDCGELWGEEGGVTLLLASERLGLSGLCCCVLSSSRRLWAVAEAISEPSFYLNFVNTYFCRILYRYAIAIRTISITTKFYREPRIRE